MNAPKQPARVFYALVNRGGIVAGQRPRTKLAAVMDPLAWSDWESGNWPERIRVWFDGNKKPVQIYCTELLVPFARRPTQAEVRHARALLEKSEDCGHGSAVGRCYICRRAEQVRAEAHQDLPAA